MVEIRMVQQMSGPRADGRSWPDRGGVIDVSEGEAEELTHKDSQSSHPIAEYLPEEERTPPPEPPQPEIRPDLDRPELAADPRPADTTLQKAPKGPRPAATPARPGVEKRD